MLDEEFDRWTGERERLTCYSIETNRHQPVLSTGQVGCGRATIGMLIMPDSTLGLESLTAPGGSVAAYLTVLRS